MMDHNEIQISPKTTMERIMFGRAFSRGVPISGSLELSPICNMNCEMCYVRLTPEELTKKGRLRTVDEWLGLAKDMAEQGVLFLLLTGGEPLIYPGFKELFVELQKMGFILTVNTNATLLDEEWAEFFSEHRPRRMNITLYGASAETYQRLCHYPSGYLKTLNAIRLLKDRNIDVKVGFSATKQNLADSDALAALCRELEVPFVMDSYMMKARRERLAEFKVTARLDAGSAAEIDLENTRLEKGDQFEAWVDRMLAKTQRNLCLKSMGQLPEDSSETMSCMGGHCSFAVNWTGNLKPCVMSPLPEINVFEEGFDSAWTKIRNYCKGLRRADKCIHCELQHLCPSCPVAELVEEGSFGIAPDYLCAMASEKQRILEIIREK